MESRPRWWMPDCWIVVLILVTFGPGLRILESLCRCTSKAMRIVGHQRPDYSSHGIVRQDMTESLIFSPGPTDRSVRNSKGAVVTIPEGWERLPPGDPGWTRRVKAAGEHWVVQEKRGRKVFSLGVWAPAETIRKIGEALQVERSTEAYTKKRASDANRREKKQAEYVDDFTAAIVTFLNFHPKHASLAEKLAVIVSNHATPVGSGTVARTERIPIEQRAASAVIAWMRHQTTAYDNMKIARVRGERRQVRRALAQRSSELLNRYRAGMPISTDCPLYSHLSNERSPTNVA